MMTMASNPSLPNQLQPSPHPCSSIYLTTFFVFFTFLLRAIYTTAFAAACSARSSTDTSCGSCDASCQSSSYMLSGFFFGQFYVQGTVVILSEPVTTMVIVYSLRLSR